MRHRWLAAAPRVFAVVVLLLAAGCGARPTEPTNLTGELLFIQDGQIVALDLATRRERRLVDLPGGGVASSPSWSPDGALVAFSYYPPPTRNAIPGSSIYVVKADGSDMRPLRTHSTPGELLESPSFSPDGQSLLFTRFLPILRNGEYVGDSLDLLRLDLRSNQVTQVTKDAIHPSFSPDGRRIAFVSIAQDSFAASLWIANVDGSNRQQIVPPNQFASIYTPRWSPDGSTIAFSGSSIPSFQRLPDGSQRVAGLARSVSDTVNGHGGRTITRPARHGLPSDVYRVAPTPNSRPSRVTELNEDDPLPLWSADGSRFVIIGALALYNVGSDGRSIARIREPGGIGGGDWRGR